MKKHNGFIEIPVLILVIVGIAILGIAGYFVAHKKSATINSQTVTTNTDINPDTSNSTEIGNLKTENNSSGAIKETTQNTKTIYPTTVKSMDSADVRAMILTKYNQTIADMKVYFSATYPDYQSLAQKYPANYFCGTSCESDFIKFQKEQGDISKYIHSTFDSLVTNFCDLNHSIQKEEDRAYCHGYFDFTRDTNPIAPTTLQRAMSDLGEWTHPPRATTSQNSTPPPVTVSMQTYTNSQYGFSVKYPNGMVYEEKHVTGSGTWGGCPGGTPFTSIVFGKANLNGGVADGGSGGWINLISDGGSSCARTYFRSESSESNTKQIGSNKFYVAGSDYFLEKSNYFILGYPTYPPNQVDLASLTFN